MQGQAGFAAAACAGECQEACSAQQGLDFLDLFLSADEAGRLLGQVIGQAGVVQGFERWEVGGQSRVKQLKDLLGPSQVFEAALAQVQQGGVRGQGIADQALSHVRKKYLSAISCGHEPCDAVQRLPKVVLAAFFYGPSVQGHPHQQRHR